MILRPSASYQWANCHGSAVMQAHFPEEDGPEAMTGTAAHHYLTESLNGRECLVGSLAPNGIPIDQDMVDDAAELIAEVWGIIGELMAAGARYELLIEQPLTMHGLIHPSVEGTPDVVLLDWTNHRLYVWDYKYGHRRVEEFENTQGVCYFAGVFERYELTRADIKGWECLFGIAQPRFYQAPPLRYWRVLGTVTWANIEHLSQQAAIAIAPDPKCAAGPWCRDCTARHACDALAEAGGISIEVSGQSVPNPVTITVAAKEYALLESAERLIKARKTGLEAFLTSRIRAGEMVAGYRIEQKFSALKWTFPIKEVLALGESYGVNLAKEPAAITPTQAKKLGVDDAVVNVYSGRVAGDFQLVRLDDNKARKAFSNG